MLLAHVVLSAQLAANVPPRSDVIRPCADASALCRISPFFCPGTYPAGLEPCWPEASRQTRAVSGGRAAAGTARTNRARVSETAKVGGSEGRSTFRPAKPTLQREP